MAQPAQELRYTVQVDLGPTRRKLRSILKLAKEANAELAALDERWDELRARLAAHNIRLEVEDDG